MTRKTDLDEFYRLLDKLGKPVRLRDCHVKMNWPTQGVYFFFEPDEYRKGSRKSLRVVRVGINESGDRVKLWKRIKNHKGNEQGGGNRGGSAFRRQVGRALMRRYPSLMTEDWENRAIKNDAVQKVERKVSEYLSKTSLLAVCVPDEPGSSKNRDYVEDCSIALLSNRRKPLDLPSKNWTGKHHPRDEVRNSGLWNVDYVDSIIGQRASGFLKRFKRYVEDTPPLH